MAALSLAVGCGPKKNTDDDDGPVVIDLGNAVDGPDMGTNSGTDGGGTNGGTNGNDNNTIPDTERDDLEVVLEGMEVEIEEGASPRLAVDIPENAESVIVAVTGEPGTFYTLREWKNGDGSDVVATGWLDSDQGAPSLCLSCENRIAASEAAFAAMLPNNDVAELVPGTHNLAVYAYQQTGFTPSPLESGTATVDVYVKVLPEEPADGVLDVNFYFTGAREWTAASAETDDEFQKVIADVDELYDQVGIDLGVITYTDIPEEYQVIESVVTPRSDLQEMFALSADQPRTAINVFIVEELMTGFGGGLGVLLGVSGGIPGPPFAGTHRSGVAIATKRSPELPTALYKVLAHEMGHHLGLFHTTEQGFGGSSVHDPIADTPENDSSLLMFHSGAGETITTTQGNVMRRNTWVNHGGAQ
jgi:hypothetical protein